MPTNPSPGGEAGPLARALPWLASAVLLAFLAFTLRDVRWGEMVRALSTARPGWILLAAAVNLLVLLFQAGRWLAVVRPLSPAATLGLSFKAMVVGFATSLVVPARAGELARAHFFGMRTGLARASVIGSILVDHLVNAAGLVVGLALLPLFVVVPGWLRPGGWIALALFLTGTLTLVLVRPPVEPTADPPKPHSALTGFLARLRRGLAGARQPRALAISLSASLVAWALEVVVIDLSARAVGLHLAPGILLLVLVAVNLALLFPFSPPGNAGTLELGAILPLLGAGVPMEQAVVFALCYHLLQVVPIGALGVVFAGGLKLARNLARQPYRAGVVS